jgi:hypothetical protein
MDKEVNKTYQRKQKEKKTKKTSKKNIYRVDYS